MALGKSLMQFSQLQNGNSITHLQGHENERYYVKFLVQYQAHKVITTTTIKPHAKKIPKIQNRPKNIYAINIQKVFLKKDTQVNLVRF